MKNPSLVDIRFAMCFPDVSRNKVIYCDICTKICKRHTDIIVHSAKENGQSNTNQRCRNACKKLFCRNERKEKAQKSLRSHWAVRILFWRSLYIWNCVTGGMMFFSHKCREEKMDFTRCGDERYNEIIWRTGICKRDKNGKTVNVRVRLIRTIQKRNK